MSIEDTLKDIPERIAPYILLTKLNEPVPLILGPFRLVASTIARLDANLNFRWLPSAAVEFAGTCAPAILGLRPETWTLEPEEAKTFSAQVHLTEITHTGPECKVRGIAEAFDVGAGPFSLLRFCLVNFPDYNGKPVQGRNLLTRGRLETSNGDGRCQLDEIPEAKKLVEVAKRDTGFAISHVGLWMPTAGVMSAKEAKAILGMLHFWFGMLCGAWVGPLFPQGINLDQEVVWQQFAGWRLRGSRWLSTWLPERTPLDLSKAFRGFAQRWNDTVWRDPLATSIAWFVEANASLTSNETRIVLAQVALELL